MNKQPNNPIHYTSGTLFEKKSPANYNHAMNINQRYPQNYDLNHHEYHAINHVVVLPPQSPKGSPYSNFNNQSGFKEQHIQGSLKNISK